MEKMYLLQVLGTYLEVSASTVSELQEKGSKLRDRHGLAGKTYRIFVGTRTNGFFKFGAPVKEATFAAR